MYAGAVKLPEMRRIGVFVQVLINDIAQLLPEGGELAHAVGIALNQLHLLFLRYEWSSSAIVASLTHPRTSRSWNTLGRSRVDVYQELALVVTIIEQFDHEGRVPGHGEMIFGQ